MAIPVNKKEESNMSNAERLEELMEETVAEYRKSLKEDEHRNCDHMECNNFRSQVDESARHTIESLTENLDLTPPQTVALLVNVEHFVETYSDLADKTGVAEDLGPILLHALGYCTEMIIKQEHDRRTLPDL